jgi:hypothetical protein
MTPIEPVEVPQLALWKACVAESLARQRGLVNERGAGIDSDDPALQGTAQYCRAMAQNQDIPKPAADADDLAVNTYLSLLHHRLAHARIANDPKLQAAIQAQTQEFKLGNAPWQDMYVRYYYYYWDYAYHEGGAPAYRSWQDPHAGRGDPNYGVIEWRLPARARIAIIGDVGTGTDQAAAVLDAALSFEPDAFLHLGDVYYSGTRFEMRHRLVDLFESVCRFGRRRVPLFTIPGNHEYFTGAKPYLATLDAGSLVDRATQRQRASYFALRSEDDGWQFLGLDTGYYGHYMNVAASASQATLTRLHLGPPVQTPTTSDPYWPHHYNPYFPGATGAGITPLDPTSAPAFVTVRADELTWHQDKLANFAGRSILLSHHQLYSALNVCGVAQKQITGADGTTAGAPDDFNRIWINTGLWRQFGEDFGSRVAAWLWGHEHNLGIYADNYRPADWPTAGSDAAVLRALPKGRCVGHGAIPVQQSEAPYAEKYPVPLVDPNLTLGLTGGWYNRGFELVELAGAGSPAKISYYQVAGIDPTPLLIYSEAVA